MNARRLILTAGAVITSAIALGGSPAMATKGQCNPAPDPYNVQQMSKGNGEVFVEVGYGWDGVSVWPACAGPLVGARVTNTSQVNTWYAHFEGRKGQPRTVAIGPGVTRTYSAAQLATAGLETLEDIAEFDLTLTP